MKSSYIVFILLFCGLVIADDEDILSEYSGSGLEEKVNDFYIRLLFLLFGKTDLMENCTTLECYYDIRVYGKNSEYYRNFSATTTTTTTPSTTTKSVRIINALFEQNGNEKIDFSQCGSFPACNVEKASDVEWRVTCSKPVVQIIVSFGIIVSVAVILSNSLIIYITLRTKALCKPHGYFKLSLAFSDLLAGVFVLPPIVYNSLNKIYFDVTSSKEDELIKILFVDEVGSAAAILCGIMSIVSSVSAVYSILLLSIDSFLSILRPLEHRIGSIMTPKLAIGLLILIWLFSIFICCVPIMAKHLVSYGMSRYTFQYIPFVHTNSKETNEKASINKYPYALFYAILVWGLPFVASWILTLATAYMSRMMLKNMKKSRAGNPKIENKMTRDLVKTVIIVLSQFTITVLPVIAVSLKINEIPVGSCQSSALTNTFFTCTYLLILGRFANVVVYNVMNKEFKEACIKLLLKIKLYFNCQNEIEGNISKRTLSYKISSSVSLGSRKSHKNSSIHSHTRRVKIPAPNSFVEKVPTKRSLSLPIQRTVKNITFKRKTKVQRTQSMTVNVA